MTLPVDWTQKTVVGDYREITGKLLAGRVVTFECNRALSFAGAQSIAPGKFKVTLDDDGTVPAGTMLPTLDHPSLDDTTSTYTVREHWAGGRTFSIVVSIDDEEVNMASVSPVATPQVWESAAEAALASALGTAATAAKDAAESSAQAASTSETNAAASAASAAASVVFAPSGTGAVSRTLQNKGLDVVTPYDFGAVGDGVANDTAAVQAFFDYLRDNRVRSSMCAGKFLLMSKLLWGNTSTEFATKNTVFDCEFITGYTSTEEAIRIASYHDASPTGRIKLTCGASTYSDRRQYDGIIIDTTSRPNFGVRLEVQGVKRWGIRNIGAGNNGRISHIYAKYCGSGRTTGQRIEPAAFTSNTTSGGANATTQRSLLGGVTVPAELQVDDFVVISGQGFRVMAVDAGAGTVQVYPWVVGTSGTMTFAIGGGLSEEGANSNVWQYGGVVTTLGGCGLRWNSSNPGNIGSFHTSSNVIGIAIGRTLSASTVGGSISECYIEGAAHDIDYLEATTSNPTGIINTTGGFVVANAQKMGPNSGTAYDTTMPVFMRLSNNGTALRRINNPRNTGSAAQTIILGSPPRQIYNNTPNITLSDLSGVDRVFGVNTIEWTCFGSGTRGQPTGTVTVTAGTGTTVNGAASVTYSGFSAPPRFMAYRMDGTTPNWVVTPMASELPLLGSKTFDWPDLATATTQSTTVTVTGAALGDFAEASMSVSLSGTRLWAEVTATDTVTVYQRNDTGANVNVASGTLRARVRKA